MALSAAERQKRSRENKKAKIAATESATIRALVERELAAFNASEEGRDLTIQDYMLSLARCLPVGDELRAPLHWLNETIKERFTQAIREAFQLTDPWPELTTGRLRDMIGTDEKRRIEAYNLGFTELFESMDGSQPLSVELKIVAHRNREWLEEPEKKAARKAQRAERQAAKAERDHAKTVATYTDASVDFGRF